MSEAAGQDDEAWDALMARPDVAEENKLIAHEIREAASNGGLGSDIEQADPMESNTPIRDFLAGIGPNPIPENKRGWPEGAVKQFMDEAMEEIAQQDRDNESRDEPSRVDDFVAAMRVISDNRELIKMVQSATCNTVSELANAMGSELTTVSRALSRMEAYGLIGFERVGGDSRAQKPLWLLSNFVAPDNLDWVQVSRVAMALQEAQGKRQGAAIASQNEAAVKQASVSPAGSTGDLYDVDFFAWTARQAAALRSLGVGTGLDVENLAAEIEGLGKAALREALDALEQALLLSIGSRRLGSAASPSRLADMANAGRACCHAIELLIQESPSLRQTLEERIPEAWAYALKEAELQFGQTGADSDANIGRPLSLKDILGDGGHGGESRG